ncbi:unnamed protein product [Leptidea sinapis]|uniref:Uncharacterized protein n=1 Tax=Leptidea sinapis TaxID=189913 RepID=A0A5E4Q0I8_9NEOP|nr:unnamed protein product [Leptidea sinapis]
MYCFFVLFTVLSGVLSSQIPDYIKVCKRDQMTINACVKDSIENLRPTLAAGIPELNWRLGTIEGFRKKPRIRFPKLHLEDYKKRRH